MPHYPRLVVGRVESLCRAGELILSCLLIFPCCFQAFLPPTLSTMSEAAAADADTTKVNLVSFLSNFVPICLCGFEKGVESATPQIHGNRISQ